MIINSNLHTDRDRDELLQAAARGYCTSQNASKVLDRDLLEAIVDEIMRLQVSHDLV